MFGKKKNETIQAQAGIADVNVKGDDKVVKDEKVVEKASVSVEDAFSQLPDHVIRAEEYKVLLAILDQLQKLNEKN